MKSWLAESKERKLVISGSSNLVANKGILAKVKEQLIKAAAAGKAKEGEKFKVSIIEKKKGESQVKDAWTMVARDGREKKAKKKVKATAKKATKKKAVKKEIATVKVAGENVA